MSNRPRRAWTKRIWDLYVACFYKSKCDLPVEEKQQIVYSTIAEAGQKLPFDKKLGGTLTCKISSVPTETQFDEGPHAVTFVLKRDRGKRALDTAEAMDRHFHKMKYKEGYTEYHIEVPQEVIIPPKNIVKGPVPDIERIDELPPPQPNPIK